MYFVHKSSSNFYSVTSTNHWKRKQNKKLITTYSLSIQWVSVVAAAIIVLHYMLFVIFGKQTCNNFDFFLVSALNWWISLSVQAILPDNDRMLPFSATAVSSTHYSILFNDDDGFFSQKNRYIWKWKWEKSLILGCKSEKF